MTNPFEGNGNDLSEVLDLEGCTHPSHCHGKRSLRQADALTDEGKRRACHRPAGWATKHPGTGRCKWHGGSTKAHEVKAEKDLAKSAVATYGLPVDVPPAQALLDEVHRTAGHVAWLGQQVARLEAGELIWGLVEEVAEPDIRNEDGDVILAKVTGRYKSAPHILLDLYQRERRHLREVCRDALAAGVNQKMLDVFTMTADTYLAMFDAVLRDLELTTEQQARVQGVMLQHLHAIGSGDHD